MLTNWRKSISAGIMIAIGGCVFLACENRYVGAVLFAVALLSICFKGYHLFTGKVGYLVESHQRQDFLSLLICLIGNLATTFLLGVLIRWAMPKLGEAAGVICASKLTQLWSQTLVRAIFCGILMYLAVSLYKEKNTLAAIFFCVPVFILSGFEHSIADMFYFGASGLYGGATWLFMGIVILGNALGGMLLPLLNPAGGEKA